MKLTAIFLTSLSLAVSASNFSQTVTLKRSNASLKSVFSIVENQTGFTFFYNDADLDKGAGVMVSLTDAPLENALSKILYGFGLGFTIKGKTIFLRKEGAFHRMSDTVSAVPPVDIYGRVTDELGRPLPGVSVMLKGTSIGTTTDERGIYSLALPDNEGRLIFSYVGYVEKELKVDGRVKIDVTMELSISSLEQMVVVGFGARKKKDLTGAVSSADLKRAKDLPNTSVVEALQGTLPGVNVVPNGRPGTAGTITIRGQRSISATNNPLIVLDGAVFGGSLSDINPTDIASVDILKDVSSSAIYGSRGANGVILITTRRGNTDKPVIDFTALYGRSNYARKLPILDRNGYLQKILDYQYELESRGLPVQGPAPVDASHPEAYLRNPSETAGYSSGIHTDWSEVIRQPAPHTDYNLSVSGKTSHTNYFFSGNYTDQKGIMLNDNFKRLSFRVNLEATVTPWLRVGTNSFFKRIDQSGVPSTLAGQLILVSPLVSPTDSLGNIPIYPMDDQGFINPIQNSAAQNKKLNSTIGGNMYISMDVPYIDGLNYRVTWANTFSNSKNYTFWTPDTYYGARGLNGSGSRVLDNSIDTWLDNVVSYKKNYEEHAVDLTLLYSYNRFHTETSSMSASNFSNTTLGYNGLSMGATQAVNQASSSYVNIGSMARLGYSFKARYLFTGTVRRDGYSAFGANSKFGTFPSFALAWVASEENFLKKAEWISFLKFRYSYGLSGNQGISPYSSLARVGQIPYVFGDVGAQSLGQYVSSLANTALGWETTLGSNYGIDLNILRSRIMLTMDYYTYRTRNLLLQRAIPSTTGFSSVLGNVGATANRGLEVSINTVNIRTDNFKWTTSFNISANKNKITSLYGVPDSKSDREMDDIANRWFIGHPIRTIYDYSFDGIYQQGEETLPGNSGQPGFIKVKDINQDGKIDADDRQIIGTADPRYRAGLTNTLEYKGFTFSFFINTVQGGINNNYLLDPAFYFATRGNYLDVGWWTPGNKSNTRPSLGYSNLLGVGFYQSTSIIRLQDVSLSYSFPQQWLDGAKINSLRVYLSAKNPYMFTDWIGYDPEMANSSHTNRKTLAAGLNLSF